MNIYQSKFLFLLFIIVHTNVFASTLLRITPEQLKTQFSDPKLIILDTRTIENYQAGHIQQALNFPISLTYEHQKINGKISQPSVIQKLFRQRGIAQDSSIIIYDSGEIVDAARLFWVLEVYGIKKVKILDHGYDDWQDKNYPIALDSPVANASNYVVSVNHKRLASKFSTQLAIRNINQLVIDARSFSDFSGQTSTAKRFGHIPSALHIPATHNIRKIGDVQSLKPLNELKKLYQRIPHDKKVIIYCAIGRVSSTNYLALRELGYDVSNYDASWNEWGNDIALPIEK